MGAPMGAPAGAWTPRSGREALAGVAWLPRLLDKGRRRLAGERAGTDLLGAYLFGDHNFTDGQLLRFLRLTGDDVLAVLRREPDDAAAAAELVRRSGRTPRELAAWSARFGRTQGLFLAMMDADEGRRPPGPGTALLRGALNTLIAPPMAWLYRRAARRRRGPPPAAAPPT
jgi:hypothetical protein